MADIRMSKEMSGAGWVQDSICYGEEFDHSLDNK